MIHPAPDHAIMRHRAPRRSFSLSVKKQSRSGIPAPRGRLLACGTGPASPDIAACFSPVKLVLTSQQFLL
jgi:hypothetical protein